VLTVQPGPYITGQSISYADWHVFGYVAQFMAGMFGCPATLWDGHPAVVEFRKTMAAREDVQAYYAEMGGDEEYRSQRTGFFP
jgi:glutathione S-transferase